MREPPLSPGEWAFFMDQAHTFDYSGRDHWTQYKLSADLDLGEARTNTGYGKRRWHLAEPEVLVAWVKIHPGTRPKSWWRWSAEKQKTQKESQYNYLKRLDLLLEGEEELMCCHS
jgi:hypothetical protein